MTRIGEFEREELLKAAVCDSGAEKTELIKLFEKLKRGQQGEDQSDITVAFEADRLPIKRYDNTRGFEPT